MDDGPDALQLGLLELFQPLLWRRIRRGKCRGRTAAGSTTTPSRSIPRRPSPEQTVANQAVSTFDAARDAFKAGDYAKALELVDQAIKTMPNDPTLHEFRGQTLFALGRYDEAAAPLYAVLSTGPGWDWTTLISLYAGPETYSQQLRATKTIATQNPSSASGALRARL